MLDKIKAYIINKPKLKELTYNILVSKKKTRPRTWTKWLLQPVFIKKGKGSFISSKARFDFYIFNPLQIGSHTVIEDHVLINNAVGPVVVGKNSLIGFSNIIIGPVTIGDNVIIAQHVVISGLNHGYENINIPISQQNVITKPIFIGDDTWVGANSVITAGVTIGKHCVVASGAVVTKNIPDYTVVVGNPARPIKKYDQNLQQWVKI